MVPVESVLLRTREARAALAIGQTTFYEWLNKGWLVGVKVGRETRITAASVKACADRLPKLTTPTMAKATLASGDQSALEKASIEGHAGRERLAKNRAAAKAKAAAKASLRRREATAELAPAE